MGVAWHYIGTLSELGVFDTAYRSILDIGSSNVYSADAGGVADFVRRFNARPRSDLKQFAERIEYGAAYDAVSGGRNGSFLGEVFEAAGFSYDAIDIADGYKTKIVDLNSQTLPPSMVGRYDLVINSGTTEHILNQYNAFQAVHDATKSGGFIWHSVPAAGYLNHGYFCYTGKFFFDLAKYNDYDIVDVWFDGPAGQEAIYASLGGPVEAMFEAASRRLSRIRADAHHSVLAALQIPTVGISVLYRKKGSRPFMGTIETSTSVGAIPSSVTDAYVAGDAPSVAKLRRSATGPWEQLRRRLFG